MHATQPLVRPAPPVDQPDTPAATLRRAADYLARHGWIQQTYFHNDEQATPACCALGAIIMVAYGYPNHEPYADHSGCGCDGFDLDGWHRFVTAEAQLMSYLGLGPSDDDSTPETVDQWNDHYLRTEDEVVTAMRDAADHHDRFALRIAEATS